MLWDVFTEVDGIYDDTLVLVLAVTVGEATTSLLTVAHAVCSKDAEDVDLDVGLPAAAAAAAAAAASSLDEGGGTYHPRNLYLSVDSNYTS